MLGSGNLGGKFTREVYAIRLNELDQPMQLIGGDKGVDRVGKEQQVCFF